MNDSSETHSYDKFVHLAAIRNEVGLYVRGEGEILPVGVCPLCCHDEGGRKESNRGDTYSE